MVETQTNYVSIHPPDLHKLRSGSGRRLWKSCGIVQYNMRSELRNIPSKDERKTLRQIKAERENESQQLKAA